MLRQQQISVCNEKQVMRYIGQPYFLSHPLTNNRLPVVNIFTQTQSKGDYAQTPASTYISRSSALNLATFSSTRDILIEHVGVNRPPNCLCL